MKKIFYILITILLLASFKVYAEEATITDLSCTKKTGGAESTLNATVDGLSINVDDVVFEDTGDFMKCTFKINNNSDDDLEVDFEAISNKSDDKITYSLTSSNGNIIKKGESNTYNLDIEYVTTYTESKTIDNEIEISLVGDKIEVPDTLIKGFALIMVVVLLIGACVILIAKRKTKLLVLLLLLLVIPSAYALTKVSIKMSNKIIVDVTPKFDVIYESMMQSTCLTEEEAENSRFIDIEKEVTFIDDEGNYLYNVFYFGDDPTPYYLYSFDKIKETYKQGETVTLINSFPTYAINYSDCEETQEADGTSTYKCDERMEQSSEDITTAIWDYTSETDELDALGFEGEGAISSTQNGNNYVISVKAPKTFVMPNHSITFSRYFVVT